MKKVSLEKHKIKVLLLEGVHQAAVDSFKQAGYENIDYLKTALSGDALKERIRDARIIGLRSRTQLTAEILEAAQRLIAIGCFCIGTNQIDLDAACIRGIPVFNAPFSNTRSVAELVIAEAILLLRGIAEKNAAAHRGVWLKSAQSAYEIRGKVLGIVGYGNIGTQLSIMAESLGMKVIFYDTVSKLPLGNAQQVSNLEALLKAADIVTLHVPETPLTKNLISQQQLDLMKPGSILINASRGTVIDIDALTQSLESKHLAGAAIDVFPVEPKSNDEEFVSSLRKFPNVFLTPHIGGSTLEAQQNIAGEVSQKLIRYSDNGTTQSAVNFPQVDLPAHPENHRILHIHRNIPGVLSDINSLFSEKQINICAQYLQTNADIGYVVIDVNQATSELALKELRKIQGTIRARILF